MLEELEPTIIKLAKSYKIPPLEWEDIAQELRIHLWENRAKYNPKKSEYKNWAYIVCRNKLRDLARHWRAKKRDHRKIVSLDELKEKGIDFEG